MQYTLYFFQQVLAAIIASVTGGNFAGVLTGCKVMLFTNTPQLTVNTSYADLTEATFDGYARSAAITWGAALNLPLGGVEVVGNTAQFTATDGTVVNQITGYAIVTGTGNHLVSLKMLPAPITVQATGDGVAVVPSVALGTAGFVDGTVAE